jgi:preprotein translocase subunit SecG
MFEFTVALHIILCILLVLIILLQPGKGGDVGAAFGGGGGGGGGMFGPRGPATLLSRGTTGVAVLFMVTSIALALFSNDAVMQNSNLDDLLGVDEGVEGALELNPDDTDAPEAGGEPVAPEAGGEPVAPEAGGGIDEIAPGEEIVVPGGTETPE